MSDSIDRHVLVLSADVKVSEVNEAIYQLMTFLPASKSAAPMTDILQKIREFIRKVVFTCDVSINLLMFKLQVKCTPGHDIEIFIKRIPVVSSGIAANSSGEYADYELIYSGEWR
jgi:hypothetical protein